MTEKARIPLVQNSNIDRHLDFSSKLPKQKKIKVFLLCGQSNMNGSGKIAELPPELKEEVKNVKAFIESDAHWDWQSSSNGWKTYKPGVEGRQEFGPDVTFVRGISKALQEEEFAIIKIAWGGTSLDRHWRSPTAGDYTGPLFTKFKNFTKKALESLDKPYEIAGMCWMQGESDCDNKEMANRYLNNLTCFIKDVRKEFNAPEMPFIIAQIDSQTTWTEHKIVRNAQLDITKTVPNTAAFDTTGFATDRIHYLTSGQLKLGNFFATEMTKFLEKKTSKESSLTQIQEHIPKIAI